MQCEELGVRVDSEFKLHFEAKHIGAQKHENCAMISLAAKESQCQCSSSSGITGGAIQHFGMLYSI